MTQRDIVAALAAEGVRVFGVFTWRHHTVDVVTLGAASPELRRAVRDAAPMAVAIRWHDDWRGPLVDLQRRIDGARGRGA